MSLSCFTYFVSFFFLIGVMPSECLLKYGLNIAHRICNDCWWDSVIGFAREYSSHKCPGCIKDLPLTEYEKQPPIFVDLTEE